jgi:hypothetical protein
MERFLRKKTQRKDILKKANKNKIKILRERNLASRPNKKKF